MKHYLLKFNAGVEIGAKLAYLGHWKRTNDPVILSIIFDEIDHRKTLEKILNEFDHKPSKVIDTFFFIVGACIYFACKFCPLWSLNFIARTMEAFAFFNYNKLARKYDYFWYHSKLKEMANKEDAHKKYFKTGIYEKITNMNINSLEINWRNK